MTSSSIIQTLTRSGAPLATVNIQRECWVSVVFFCLQLFLSPEIRLFSQRWILSPEAVEFEATMLDAICAPIPLTQTSHIKIHKMKVDTGQQLQPQVQRQRSIKEEKESSLYSVSLQVFLWFSFCKVELASVTKTLITHVHFVFSFSLIYSIHGVLLGQGLHSSICFQITAQQCGHYLAMNNTSLDSFSSTCCLLAPVTHQNCLQCTAIDFQVVTSTGKAITQSNTIIPLKMEKQKFSLLLCFTVVKSPNVNLF